MPGTFVHAWFIYILKVYHAVICASIRHIKSCQLNVRLAAFASLIIQINAENLYINEINFKLKLVRIFVNIHGINKRPKIENPF